MLLLSRYISVQSDREGLNLKAPKGYAFLIKAINSSIYNWSSTPDGTWLFVDTKEAEGTNPTQPLNPLYTHTWYDNGTTAIRADFNHSVSGIDETTKYISVIAECATGNVRWQIQIYGELVKMSIKDQIWEFINKSVV